MKIADKIVEMSPEELGQVIAQIRAMNWTEAHKDTAIKFVMLLGLINKRKHPVQ